LKTNLGWRHPIDKDQFLYQSSHGIQRFIKVPNSQAQFVFNLQARCWCVVEINIAHVNASLSL